MNFDMPEVRHPWGYLIALASMAAVAGVMPSISKGKVDLKG